MYKILEENVKLRLDEKWYSTTAILTCVSGGKQINYLAADGTILKSQAYSRSCYSKVAKEGDGFEEIEEKSREELTEKPSFSDPDFYAKQLRSLGLKDIK